MEIVCSDVVSSPTDPGRVRLAADVEYATGVTESYWFEVPSAHADELESGGDPWLAALAPLAASTGEPLRSQLPVDPLLLRGVRRALLTWSGWDATLSAPAVSAPVRDSGGRTRGTRGGCLFSGGVDSFFTLLRHRSEETLVPYRIDDLLTVGGLDIPLERASEIEALMEKTQEIADAVGARAVEMTTNVRETRWRAADWSGLSHGPLLAACGLALGSRWNRILVPSSLPYVRSQRPWGSHPLTDPMFSTRSTEIVYDGASHLRTEKTVRVAESGLAMRLLRVCWIEEAADNCGRCAKCWRTMATLEAAGALERCSAFPPGSFSVSGLSGLRVRSGAEARMLERVVPFAEENERDDLVRALRRAVRRSRFRMLASRCLERLRAIAIRRFDRSPSGGDIGAAVDR